MPQIKLTNVTKRWGKFFGVDNLSMVIEDNAFVTLLGPSGCGKTTTLRMIAGLETPTSGKIEIGDTVVFDSEKGINIPANDRRVGFLFQNYALWPNMTVYKNIAFGLGNIKQELPVYDFEAKVSEQIVEILKSSVEVVELINNCRDKDGKIDEDKILLKLIDTFTISMFTAKKIFKMNLHEEEFPSKKAEELCKEYEAKIEKITSSYLEKGLSLNDDFALIQNGAKIKKLRKLTQEEIDLAVRRVSRVVKIGMFMDRYPSELSGGQQQRVAIARTLAPEPKVLFMDEPLSNLDAKLRLEMRYELQRLHIETGSTFVYVTHDQMEAMTLATKICLMNNGVLQQYDAPLDVYNRPKNLFVADFVGNPSINFIEAKGQQEGDEIKLKVFGEKDLVFKPSKSFNLEKWYEEREKNSLLAQKELEEASKQKGYVEKANKDEVFKYHIAKVVDEESVYATKEEPLDKGDFILAVRPEFIKLEKNAKFEGEISGAMPTGMESTIKISTGNFLLTGVVFGGTTFTIGSHQNFDFVGEGIMLFDRKSGKLITLGSVE
ncbi:ABC transporter ATP-binding protein [Treponema pectinovorum]|uniref:ABC transporter ATP-binding protein n=1 Tax=Treponema pectinovorum TaxID=164 RepID=UPI0011F31ACF|nr:ABC transporter ATP-binding protein [Treponema pectinovorum]